ncbi:uncharacterized protein LOC141902163 [Tubulanus polymorphus]|uniref:uncharacterized protein LOC141902163 n=1 Tax=Tubulanus polymorphus TaxID=672921 RepID=UPI003DA280D6
MKNIDFVIFIEFEKNDRQKISFHYITVEDAIETREYKVDEIVDESGRKERNINELPVGDRDKKPGMEDCSKAMDVPAWQMKSIICDKSITDLKDKSNNYELKGKPANPVAEIGMVANLTQVDGQKHNITRKNIAVIEDQLDWTIDTREYKGGEMVDESERKESNFNEIPVGERHNKPEMEDCSKTVEISTWEIKSKILEMSFTDLKEEIEEINRPREIEDDNKPMLLYEQCRSKPGSEKEPDEEEIKLESMTATRVGRFSDFNGKIRRFAKYLRRGFRRAFICYAGR